MGATCRLQGLLDALTFTAFTDWQPTLFLQYYRMPMSGARIDGHHLPTGTDGDGLPTLGATVQALPTTGYIAILITQFSRL